MLRNGIRLISPEIAPGPVDTTGTPPDVPKVTIDASDYPAVKVLWIGAPNHAYQVEASENLSSQNEYWVPASPIIYGTGAAVESQHFTIRPKIFRVRAWRVSEGTGTYFDLSVVAYPFYEVEPASKVTDNYLDSVRTTVSTKKLASQFQVNVVNVVGSPGSVIFSVPEGSDKASIDPATGVTTYLADGTFEVEASGTGYSKRTTIRNESQQSINYSYTLRTDLTPGDQVLVLYNSSCPESIEVKNYYQANRPGAAGFNYLGVDVYHGEVCPQQTFESSVVTPLLDWMLANPSKPIRYVVYCHGLPTRVYLPYFDAGFLDQHLQFIAPQTSALMYLCRPGEPDSEKRNQTGYIGKSAFLDESVRRYIKAKDGYRCLGSYLGMGSVAQTKAYIDRLAAAPFKSADNLYIAGSGAELFIFDEWQSKRKGMGGTGDMYNIFPLYIEDGFRENYGDLLNPDLRILDGLNYIARPPEDPAGRVTAASNVASFVDWGFYAGTGDLACLTDLRQWSGNSWYIMTSVESFNGQFGKGWAWYQLGLTAPTVIDVISATVPPSGVRSMFSVWVNTSTGETWEYGPGGWESAWNERIASILYPRNQYHNTIDGLRSFKIWINSDPISPGPRDWKIDTAGKETRWRQDDKWILFQGGFQSWFSRGAFGSVNYEHCPIAAFVHVFEPNLSGIASGHFYRAWYAGLPFAECAMAGRGSNNRCMPVGDPLVCLNNNLFAS